MSKGEFNQKKREEQGKRKGEGPASRPASAPMPDKGGAEKGSGMGFFRGGGEAEVAARFLETRRDTMRNIKRQKTLGEKESANTCVRTPF